MKKFLDWINGKKTIIGLIGHGVWLASNLIFSNLATPEQSAYGHLIIGSVTGVGLSHKVVKWNTETKQKEK